MTNRSNDDIANALRGLADGAPSDPGHAARPAPPAPRMTPAGAPTSPPNVAGQPPRPASPGAQRPDRPSQPSVVPASRRSAAPVAPGGPAASGAPPRPGEPTATPQFTVADAAESAGGEDDAASMPAPSMDYLAARPHHSSRPTTSPRARSATFRRTAIPVLITTAALLLATVLTKYAAHPDAPLAALPTWLVVLLAAAAVVMLVVAVLNVIQVGRDSAAGADLAVD